MLLFASAFCPSTLLRIRTNQSGAGGMGMHIGQVRHVSTGACLPATSLYHARRRYFKRGCRVLGNFSRFLHGEYGVGARRMADRRRLAAHLLV